MQHEFTYQLKPGMKFTGPTMGIQQDGIRGTVTSVTRKDTSHYYVIRYTDDNGVARKTMQHKVVGWVVG